MGSTALRQLLKSFCSILPWNYAVLWKLLRRENHMILSWEDGCCEYPKPRETVEKLLEDVYCTGANNGIFLSNWETRVNNGSSGGYSIGLMVAKMSHLCYTLGDGVVGKVADTGNHLWFSYDNVSNGKLNSKLIQNCPQEWLLQLASGIKTVLLVPVLPHGVIQLGSLELIAEDLAMVAYIKDKFALHYDTYGVPFTSEKDIQTQPSFALMSGLMWNLDEPSATTICPVKSEHSETVDSVKPSDCLLSTIDQFVPLIDFEGALHISGLELSGSFRKESENKIGVPPVGLDEVSKSPSLSMDDCNLEMVESKLFELSCLEEELEAYFQRSKCKLEVLGESHNGAMNTYPAGCSAEQPFKDQISSGMDYRNLTGSLSFPEDCELHNALGPTFQSHEYLLDSLFSADNTHGPGLVYDRADRTESVWLGKGGDGEHLLEAVVANGYSGSDDNSSDMCNSIKSSLTLGQITASTMTQTEFKANFLIEDEAIPMSHVASACVAVGTDEFTPASVSFESIKDPSTNREHHGKGYNNTQPRKGTKLSSVSKRRAKPGENQKPRPRDRQLIQDRIKELRELVPNGVKCSIDGLLGRTIDHMLYLRNVTNQAEKLRQWVHQEVAARKDLRSSETKDNIQNGKTWAYEFGNNHFTCPIVVEDLAYPGHMLIEMLCNEHGLFLEIAQVIRSVDLTILKGVMESRSSDTWAHFIVEASKGFHRVDIFWPLMHLLQRKNNPISSKF